jgi:hypothetical protein
MITARLRPREEEEEEKKRKELASVLSRQVVRDGMDACQWHGSFRDADGWCRRAEPW